MRIAVIARTMALALCAIGCGRDEPFGKTKADGDESTPKSADATPGKGTTTSTDPGSAGGTGDDEDTVVDRDIVVVEPKQPPDESVGPGEPVGATLCYKAEPFVCDVERRIVELTNELRGAGRTPLTIHAGIAFVARDWSGQQAASDNIGHNGFPRAREATYLAEFGDADPVSIQAENVAYSYSRSQTDVEAVARMFVDMWSGSAGHRANMLGGYRFLGVGIVFSGSSVYATQIFGG